MCFSETTRLTNFLDRRPNKNHHIAYVRIWTLCGVARWESLCRAHNNIIYIIHIYGRMVLFFDGVNVSNNVSAARKYYYIEAAAAAKQTKRITSAVCFRFITIHSSYVYIIIMLLLLLLWLYTIHVDQCRRRRWRVRYVLLLLLLLLFSIAAVCGHNGTRAGLGRKSFCHTIKLPSNIIWYYTILTIFIVYILMYYV